MDTAARVIPECVTDRMLTLAEVLELPVVRRALPEVIVGADALERELRWAHVIEMPDPDDLLKGGELVLTTGHRGGRRRRRDQTRWIGPLLDQGAGGGDGRARHDAGASSVPDAGGRARARRRTCRWWRSGAQCASSRSPRPCTRPCCNRQFELLRRGEEIHRRFTELILQGRGVPEILAELAAAVGSPVVLEDAGARARLLRLAGRRGDDVALSRVGRPAPRRGPRRDAGGRAAGRRAADGLARGGG